MRFSAIVLLAVSLCPLARAGLQQDFFASQIEHVTRVRILKIGLDHLANGAMRKHVLLDSIDRRQIKQVSESIEMIDPRPEKVAGVDEEVWVGSGLAFGLAEYVIQFYQNESMVLSYGLASNMSFVTPFGAHAPQGTDLMLDYVLTSRSSHKLKRLVHGLRELPNQTPDPTPMAVTHPAAQAARQP